VHDGLNHGSYAFFMTESHYYTCFVDDANQENGNVGVEEVFRTTILGPTCLELQNKLMNQDWAFMGAVG
jgi:hypothetical protein